jgi:hypothetical protein
MNTTDIKIKEEKKSNSTEIFQYKRSFWNSRRKYNYKYITTVF